jgi:hypothetical protein
MEFKIPQMLYKTVMPTMPQIISFIQIGKSAINSLLEKFALPPAPG